MFVFQSYWSFPRQPQFFIFWFHIACLVFSYNTSSLKRNPQKQEKLSNFHVKHTQPSSNHVKTDVRVYQNKLKMKATLGKVQNTYQNYLEAKNKESWEILIKLHPVSENSYDIRINRRNTLCKVLKNWRKSALCQLYLNYLK